MTDVLKLLRVVSVSDESLLSLLMEERPLSPATVQSGNITAMGMAMTMTATPTNATVGTMGTTETTGTAEERIQISFEVTKANVQMFQQLFDPGSGGFLKHGKMLSWFLSLFPSQSQ
ncbi:hypothetical protein NP493_340g02008 [Ridgeia piscesae]|uniref:Uncharacterized protein n=1 Tax=Ridgeia piscesae TaxID=27915 RepID=A0AAD9NVN1_RIDPI|nr:hypothetical protein NP493_340g02008 [Ridgeia piscesae]